MTKVVEVQPEVKPEGIKFKPETKADAKPKGRHSAVTDGTIKNIESMKEYEELVETTNNSGKPLMRKFGHLTNSS